MWSSHRRPSVLGQPGHSPFKTQAFNQFRLLSALINTQQLTIWTVDVSQNGAWRMFNFKLLQFHHCCFTSLLQLVCHGWRRDFHLRSVACYCQALPSQLSMIPRTCLFDYQSCECSMNIHWDLNMSLTWLYMFFQMYYMHVKIE